jgi:ABC-type sugar transport system ATPase subunit
VILRVANISKSYGTHEVLRDVALSVGEGETLSILGRSGCGKTTLLKIVAGLVDAGHGDIHLKGERINDMPVAQRNIVYIYQEPLLFPHLSVFENIAFGLRVRKREEGSVRSETGRMLDDLDLASHAGKMPHQLSGGQRQRVAFGRAIIINPSVLLLDEPFSNLDAETRASMQILFKRLADTYRIASVFVTHDLKEAILLGDTIAYMEEGRLIHFSDKREFIEHPEYGARREIEFWTSLGRENYE